MKWKFWFWFFSFVAKVLTKINFHKRRKPHKDKLQIKNKLLILGQLIERIFISRKSVPLPSGTYKFAILVLLQLVSFPPFWSKQKCLNKFYGQFPRKCLYHVFWLLNFCLKKFLSANAIDLYNIFLIHFPEIWIFYADFFLRKKYSLTFWCLKFNFNNLISPRYHIEQSKYI